MENFDFSRWFQLNILLPLAPFFLKLFIVFMGNKEKTAKIKIFETPELLFFSLTTCIIALNINIDGNKNKFEGFLRLFLTVVMVLDFVMLGMIYSGNAGVNSTKFSIIVAVIPMILAPFYQVYVLRREEGGQSNAVQ